MKKLILLFVLALSVSVVTVSCKGEQKEQDATETKENHAADKADMAMNDKYICPMDCEDGKTYDIAGICPKCEMDLKKVEPEKEGEDGAKHEDHNDDKDHS